MYLFLLVYVYISISDILNNIIITLLIIKHNYQDGDNSHNLNN